MIEIPDCPDGAECSLGFTIDGLFYDAGCSEVIDELVSDQVIGTAPVGTDFTEARTITGVRPGVLVAARGPVDMCGSDDRWNAAFPSPPQPLGRDEALEQATAICAVLVDPGEGDRCDEGGSAAWFEEVDGSFAAGYAYFPSYVSQIETAPVDDPNRQWRTDPVEVIKRTRGNAYAPGDLCDSESLTICRIAIAEPQGDSDRETVVGVIELQTGSISEITAFTVTIERLIPGGDTWWVTRYTEQLSGPNPDLSCCPVLIIDKP